MTFADITAHFEANRTRPAALAWDDPHQLGPATLRAVASSLQAFQCGEGSSGDHLLALASQVGDADYATAMQLFIWEEAGHAELLGQFMDRQGIARRQSPWLHAVLRGLGRPLGLVHLVRVMLTAEVVATVCYQALYQATYSGLLQQICRRILREQELHLVFHCLAVQQLVPRRNWLSAWLGRQAYRGLLAGTALVAYASCRRALRAGGYSLGRFCAAIAAECARVEQLQRPGSPLAVRGEQPAPPLAAGPAGAWHWPSQLARPAGASQVIR